MKKGQGLIHQVHVHVDCMLFFLPYIVHVCLQTVFIYDCMLYSTYTCISRGKFSRARARIHVYPNGFLWTLTCNILAMFAHMYTTGFLCVQGWLCKNWSLTKFKVQVWRCPQKFNDEMFAEVHSAKIFPSKYTLF